MSLAADPALKAKGVDLRYRAEGRSGKHPALPRRRGRPLRQVGLDRDGRAGIDWGVYGVPETFIVKGDGAIAFKLVGPIGPDTLESVVKPEILKAMN